MKPIKVKYWWVYIVDHPNFTGCLIDRDNDKSWYQNGNRHREDGPAIEYANGDKEWWFNHKHYNEQEWIIATRKIKLERILKNNTCI